MAVGRSFSGIAPIFGPSTPPALTGSSLTAGWAQRAAPAALREAIGWAERQSRVGRGLALGPRSGGRACAVPAVAAPCGGSGGAEPVPPRRRWRCTKWRRSPRLTKVKNSPEGPVSAPAGAALGHRPPLVFVSGSGQRRARPVGREAGGPGPCVMAAALVSAVPGPGGDGHGGSSGCAAAGRSGGRAPAGSSGGEIPPPAPSARRASGGARRTPRGAGAGFASEMPTAPLIPCPSPLASANGRRRGRRAGIARRKAARPGLVPSREKCPEGGERP